ncbi:hypothetical protein KFK09_017769 [Dendrobium nobile]|uniref:Uncharacterized protein n=1 Tax=Dendrobium nobile TaxID=94219 RepID=A0A8T3ASY3_DENNO|nr:hypothetical protein KFK09_017769 [Dendrobium nobile]
MCSFYLKILTNTVCIDPFFTCICTVIIGEEASLASISKFDLLHAKLKKN